MSPICFLCGSGGSSRVGRFPADRIKVRVIMQGIKRQKVDLFGGAVLLAGNLFRGLLVRRVNLWKI